MRRTRLRTALLIVVGAALGGIGYLVSRNVVAHRAHPLEELGRDFLPQVAQRIQNFRRIKVEHGRMMWEITARDAQFFEQENQIVVLEPRVTFFMKEEGRKAHLKGAEGRITLDGHEMKAVTLRGGVAVELDDMELETAEATYDRAKDLITSPGDVTIHGRTLDARGRGRGSAGAPARALPLAAALVLTALAGVAAAEPAKEPPKGGALFDAGSFGSKKEPIVVTSDTLEYDYKTNVVVYRGDVIAVQADTKVRSNTLTVTLAAQKDSDPPDTAKKGDQRLQEVIAVGSVRIDNGTRWATGGRAVFEQATRTLVLTENPVLHDGANEVSGDRVTLYLDENRSVVDGGRRRVKATVFPNKDGGLAGANAAPPKDEAPSPQAAAGGGEGATP